MSNLCVAKVSGMRTDGLPPVGKEVELHISTGISGWSLLGIVSAWLEVVEMRTECISGTMDRFISLRAGLQQQHLGNPFIFWVFKTSPDHRESFPPEYLLLRTY